MCSAGVMPASGSTASVMTGMSGCGASPESVSRAVYCVVTVCAARFVEDTTRRERRIAVRIEEERLHTALNIGKQQGVGGSRMNVQSQNEATRERIRATTRWLHQEAAI